MILYYVVVCIISTYNIIFNSKYFSKVPIESTTDNLYFCIVSRKYDYTINIRITILLKHFFFNYKT